MATTCITASCPTWGREEGNLGLLRDALLPRAKDNPEARALFHRMMGDSYQSMATASPEGGYGPRADESYRQALTIARENLSPAHPVRLGIADHYAVCLHDTLRESQQAIDLARLAIDEASAGLEALDVSSRKESQLILDSLRDHLKHWT